MRWMSLGGEQMRKTRTVESAEDRHQRLTLEAQSKRDGAAVEEAAIYRMIRRNIEQFGA